MNSATLQLNLSCLQLSLSLLQLNSSRLQLNLSVLQQEWQLEETRKHDVAAATRTCSSTTVVNNSL